jgi:hypothetical protein
LDSICDDTEDGGEPEEDSEEVGDFAEEDAPGGFFLFLWEFVISFLGISFNGLLGS